MDVWSLRNSVISYSEPKKLRKAEPLFSSLCFVFVVVARVFALEHKIIPPYLVHTNCLYTTPWLAGQFSGYQPKHKFLLLLNVVQDFKIISPYPVQLYIGTYYLYKYRPGFLTNFPVTNQNIIFFCSPCCTGF